jgi:CubicO group peptidase (beta-lactamase class C family)
MITPPKGFSEKLDAVIDASTFSGVVSIRQHGLSLYERAAGYADRSNRVANTLDTRFGIASGTKFLTALAIGNLIAAGKILVSTKLRDCVTLDFPHQYSPDITIGHLLTHTSGVPDYLDEEKIQDYDHFSVSRPWYELKGPKDYLGVFPNEPMKFAPGARFSYSNGGYILLGAVIEEVTGLRYQQFVEQQIFKPIGMERSGFFAFNQLPGQTALGYIEMVDGWRTNIYNLPIIGASDGGAYTTVDDIAKLWKAFWADELVPHELVELFAAPYVKVETEKEGTYYGHGLWISKASTKRTEFYMLGNDAGVSFRSSILKESGLQVTVISNVSNGAWPIVREINEILT